MFTLPLNKGVKPTKPTLPIGRLWFIFFAGQTYNMSSKLGYWRKYTICSISLQEHHFPILPSDTEKYFSIETEQLYLCRVLHFTCQNLRLTNPRNYWAIACGTDLLKISHWTTLLRSIFSVYGKWTWDVMQACDNWRFKVSLPIAAFYVIFRAASPKSA